MLIISLVCGLDGHDIWKKGTCDHYLEREEITMIKKHFMSMESKVK